MFQRALGDRILLNVASDELELFSGLYSGVVIAILPARFVLCQERACLAANVAHHVMHKFGENPRLTQSKQGNANGPA